MSATNELFDREEVAEVLSGTFYGRNDPGARRAIGASFAQPLRAVPPQSDKPTHYKVICISLYNEDLGRLDKMVEALKQRGFTKANRSALIRMALDQVDLSQAKKGL
jgi:hypothetical protein